MVIVSLLVSENLNGRALAKLGSDSRNARKSVEKSRPGIASASPGSVSRRRPRNKQSVSVRSRPGSLSVNRLRIVSVSSRPGNNEKDSASARTRRIAGTANRISSEAVVSATPISARPRRIQAITGPIVRRITADPTGPSTMIAPGMAIMGAAIARPRAVRSSSTAMYITR